MAGRRRSFTRAEARLWTGPVAHLVGGALDVLGALARYGLARLQERWVGRRSVPASWAGRRSVPASRARETRSGPSRRR